jgi:hypothetical protein
MRREPFVHIARWFNLPMGGGFALTFRRLVMSMRENDETLVRQTISRLLDFHGMEVVNEGGIEMPAELDTSIHQPPALEHLELGDPVAAAVAGEEFAEGPLDNWGEPAGYASTARYRVNHARRKKMVLMIPLLSILLLVVLNRFHGMPLLGSEWLRLGTYEKMVGEIVESGFSSIEDDSQHPVRLKVRGIAFTSERPSAVVGTTIVHEGDVVLGATIVEISRGNVKFEVNGETWTQKVQ